MKNRATVEICSIKRKIAHKTAERVLRKGGTHKAHSTQRGGQIFSPKFSPGSRSRQKRRSHIHVQTQKRKPFFSACFTPTTHAHMQREKPQTQGPPLPPQKIGLARPAAFRNLYFCPPLSQNNTHFTQCQLQKTQRAHSELRLNLAHTKGNS